MSEDLGVKGAAAATPDKPVGQNPERQLVGVEGCYRPKSLLSCLFLNPNPLAEEERKPEN